MELEELVARTKRAIDPDDGEDGERGCDVSYEGHRSR